MRKCVVVGLLVSAAVSGLPATAEAGSKTGCPAEASGWVEMTVQDAAETVYAGLLDKPPGGAEDWVKLLEDAVNFNGDDKVCLTTRWGDHLNPKSHWYKVGIEVLGEPTTLFIVVDNNANANK